MLIIKIALRNLARHKKRTIFTAIVIAVAICFYVFADALILGMMDSSYENITEYEYGHIQLMSTEYWEDKDDLPLQNLISLGQDTIDQITGRPEVTGYAPRLDFTAELTDGRDSIPLVGRGIDLEQEATNFRIDDSLVEGSYIQAGEPEAVIGQSLAEDMELGVGDFFMLVVRNRDESFNVIDLTVAGIINTPNPYINDNVVFLPINLARDALLVDEDQASHISLKLTDRELAAGSSAEITELMTTETGSESYQAFSWEQDAEDLIVMQEYSDMVLIMVLGVILLLAMAGIANTVILSVIERLKEIGMMKAMGMKVKEVTFLIGLEAAGIGILGGLLGVVLGAGAVYLLTTYGINIYAGMEGELDLPISMAVIYGSWKPGTFIFVFVYSVIVSFISGLIPAYWGAKKNPVDILHE